MAQKSMRSLCSKLSPKTTIHGSSTNPRNSTRSHTKTSPIFLLFMLLNYQYIVGVGAIPLLWTRGAGISSSYNSHNGNNNDNNISTVIGVGNGAGPLGLTGGHWYTGKT
ncbi:4176_t:CDS:1, partial [Ambispora leptoticha]